MGNLSRNHFHGHGTGGPTASGAIYTGGAVPASTRVTYSDGTTLTGDSGFTRASLALTVDSGSDGTYIFGSARTGFISGGTTGAAYWAHKDATPGQYALRQIGALSTVCNGVANVFLSISNSVKCTLATTSFTFASGVPVTISDSTASTTTATGCLILSGGLGVAGAITCGSTINSGSVISSAGLAAAVTAKTADYTATASDYFVTADATSGNVTITLPAANARGAGKTPFVRVKRIDSSGNTVTVQRAGSDTIDGGTTTTLAALGAKDFSSSGGTAWYIC